MKGVYEMEFGKKLKILRLKQRLTQAEIAKSIGISRRAYVNYELKNVRPRKQEVYDKLAESLGCSVGYLKVDGPEKVYLVKCSYDIPVEDLNDNLSGYFIVGSYSSLEQAIEAIRGVAPSSLVPEYIYKNGIETKERLDWRYVGFPDYRVSFDFFVEESVIDAPIDIEAVRMLFE